MRAFDNVGGKAVYDQADGGWACPNRPCFNYLGRSHVGRPAAENDRLLLHGKRHHSNYIICSSIGSAPLLGIAQKGHQSILGWDAGMRGGPRRVKPH
jgi:hypothetical protein